MFPPTQALVICVSLSWFSLSVTVSIRTALLAIILLAVNNGKSLAILANNTDITSQLASLNVTSQLAMVIRKLNSKLLLLLRLWLLLLLLNFVAAAT